MTREFKIRNRKFEIKKGDYVLFNGACYQFVAGDKRTLYFEHWSSYSSIRLTQKVIKELKLETLKTVVTGKEEDKTLMIRYFFE